MDEGSHRAATGVRRAPGSRRLAIRPAASLSTRRAEYSTLLAGRGVRLFVTAGFDPEARSENGVATMTVAPDDRKFNDDLLLHEADRELAARKYSTIYHVLDNAELRELFSEYDEPANLAKRRGLRAGMWAIALGFSALALAALEIWLGFPTSGQTAGVEEGQHWATLVLAVVSATSGIASVLIGSAGILLARRKREWLYQRLMGERIRQFHFQTFVFRLPQILKSLGGEADKSAFVSERRLWLDSFKKRFVGKLDSAFAAAIEEDEATDQWLHEDVKADGAGDPADAAALKPLFEAYRELRILHQIDYANYKLKDDHKLISSVPRSQLAVLSQLNLIWIIFLCVMHVGIVLGALRPHSVWAAFHSPEIIVAIIWLALAALATRAVEQGLQPEREIERYQQYRSGVRAILERYDAAPTQAAKVRIMREMEQLAFDEMRNFLITNERSRFVM
jgi:hypothetical protein